MAEPSDASDQKGRNPAAESLQRQIDDLVAGRTRPRRPSSLREFIEQKMAEDKGEPPEAKARAGREWELASGSAPIRLNCPGRPGGLGFGVHRQGKLT